MGSSNELVIESELAVKQPEVFKKLEKFFDYVKSYTGYTHLVMGDKWDAKAQAYNVYFFSSDPTKFVTVPRIQYLMNTFRYDTSEIISYGNPFFINSPLGIYTCFYIVIE